MPGRSPFAFVEGALDRADALRDDQAALARLWPQAGVIVLNERGEALTDAHAELLTPSSDALRCGLDAATFLGVQGERAWFFVEAAAAGMPGAASIDLRKAAAQWPAWQSTLFAQARALQHWHRRYRFCSACGGRLRYERAGWLGRCEGCQSEHYPRTDQAIIVAVTDGERLLLGRQAGWAPRRWSVVAGFVEPGETLEQTVAREVMEETGVRVRPQTARYLASQPWPFPGSLMLGFLAHAEPDLPQASEELVEARWFNAEEVRAGLARDWSHADEAGEGIVLSSPISIARFVMRCWLDAYDAGAL